MDDLTWGRFDCGTIRSITGRCVFTKERTTSGSPSVLKMDFLRSFRAPDPKLLIGSFKSIFAPHYIVNVFLACSFYVLKTVSPICEYMFEDCSIELVSSWHWSILKSTSYRHEGYTDLFSLSLHNSAWTFLAC